MKRLNIPSDLHIPLWRYMEFTKFLALLESGSLYFARADTMTDKFEGVRGAFNTAQHPMVYGEHSEKISSTLSKVTAGMRRFVYLNCWHASSYESAAMWGLYQHDNRGIAIRSTLQKLRDGLKGDLRIGVETVSYVDYDSYYIPENNLLAPYLYKRQSFEHEREVRAVLNDVDAAVVDGSDECNLDVVTPPGLSVAVDLNALVDEVYIAPGSDEWFTVLVEQIIRRYGLEWPVKHSILGRDLVG